MTGGSDIEPRGTAFQLLGDRLGRDSAVYVTTAVANMVVGLASVAVLTRMLDPAEYGKVGILALFATLLTITYNAGSLQGTFAYVRGTTGDDDFVEDEAPPEGGVAVDKRRGMMTGLVITLIAGSLGTAIVLLFASSLAELLTKESRDSELVILMAAAGATASVWRMCANGLRLDLRPGAYFTATLALSLGGLVASVALVAAGEGVRGAVAGMLIGNVLGTAVALGLFRQNLRLAVSIEDAREIYRRGRALIPVVFSFYTIQMADLFMVSRVASAGEVGVYRVAARIGSFVSYWTTSFLMAWGAMRRDPLHVAADRERGEAEIGAALGSYFVIATLWVILAASLLSQQLVKLAGPAFGGAADLIPLTATAWGFHGLYVAVYRTSNFRDKRKAFIVLTVVGALTFVLGGIVLVPALGLYGAPLAVILGWSIGTFGLWLLGQRGDTPTPYEYRRVLVALGSMALCLGAGVGLRTGNDLVDLPVELVAIAAYPFLLMVGGALTPYQMRVARTMVRQFLPRAGGGPTLDEAHLSAVDRAVFDLVVMRGMRVDTVARMAGVEVGAVHRTAVSMLRSLSGSDMRGERDELIGAYLFDESLGNRGGIAERLWRAGEDPLEVATLRAHLKQLRRKGRSRRGVRRPGRHR